MRLQTVLHAVFPPECLSCSALVGEDFALCGACWSETPFILSTICDICGAPLPGQADPDERLACDDCRAMPRPWNRGRAVMVYAGTARRLILGLKHGDRAEVARAAGPWLARAAQDLLQPETVLVPIPLHRGRLMRRRFNQSALLAQAMARATGADVAVDALLRVRATPSLDGLGREERRAALDRAIAPHPGNGRQLEGRPVLLIDDVMTSGATFAAASEAARRAGADNVSVIALARVCRDA
ncbi:ComF family protein [Rhodobacterales bacterium HKCCE3408]|nr:ComF family protein [Rhodobacterales bacterium HKCCE3408]